MPPRPPPPPPHVAAEYAKSARSTCKMCTKAILKKALRVGIVSRDGRGFDMTKWHHLDCFPVGAVTVASTEEIKGFEALQSGDQEALKKLLDGGDKSAGDAVVHKRDNDEENEPEERDVKKAKRTYGFDLILNKVNCFQLNIAVHKRDSDEENEPEERDVKKGKLSPSYREANLDIAFSVSSVKNMYKDATLQPKWKAFKTIIFLEQDDGLHDSHKIAAFDFDGTLAKTSVNRYGNLSPSYREANLDIAFSVSSVKNMYKDDGLHDSHKIAAFDFDGTLAKTSVNRNDLQCASCNIRKWSLDVYNWLISRAQSLISLLNWLGLSTLYPFLLCKQELFRILLVELDQGSGHFPKETGEKWIHPVFSHCCAYLWIGGWSGRRIGADAWSLMHPSVPDKLQSLYNDGYKLVIFTNESNIERWKKKRQVAVDSKIGRLNNFIKQVKVPIQVFVACGLGGSSGQAADAFRKPNLGMWHIMERHFNSGISIDMDQSFYVGDAAGRLNDHSDADVKFAQAIGLKFYAPEEYFVSGGSQC
ncbi:Polynucleotide 3'-phosphatase ZDP [Morella rubra]|uniref:Polynucleotide 3'-phosphatase ZDP n=1 Tax=Morella rubra TaxID=262757 RepID=A0A6A1VU82_9ROSI|nr:Polynucleotide 3'-phosphatase ZDP [Morella rubra]